MTEEVKITDSLDKVTNDYRHSSKRQKFKELTITFDKSHACRVFIPIYFDTFCRFYKRHC